MTTLYSYSIGFGVGVRNPKVAANFEIPRGSCDSHLHVIGDPSVFSMSPERDNTPPSATANELQRMLQFLTLSRVVIVTPAIYTDNLATIAAIRQLGQDLAALLPELDASPVPLVFDTFGWLAGGVHQEDFDGVLSLVRSGRSYVKLSELYRFSKSRNYADLVPVVQALVEANSDRVLWGSG